MMFKEESLLLVTQGSITSLHRQSYYKKWVISVSDKNLIKLKKAEVDGKRGLLCMDETFKVFFVDIHTKNVKMLYQISMPAK